MGGHVPVSGSMTVESRRPVRLRRRRTLPGRTNGRRLPVVRLAVGNAVFVNVDGDRRRTQRLAGYRDRIESGVPVSDLSDAATTAPPLDTTSPL